MKVGLKQWPLAAAIASILAVGGLAAMNAGAGPVYTIDNGGPRGPAATVVLNIDATQTARYIVRFKEPSLAQYNSAVSAGVSKAISGIASIPTRVAKNGRQRLDVHSPAAVTYVNYLKTQQQNHLTAMDSALGRSVTQTRPAMQYALNAVVLDLYPGEVARIASLPDVAAVDRDISRVPATDIGPGFIGASSLWWGTPAGQDSLFANGFDNAGGFRGDGIVIGDIDTGYNSASPSFSATDDHGYTIQNPLGSGNYIGQCGVPGISTAGCNNKVIGVYDMVDTAAPFSVEDTQGHGSHTASTAAGNSRMATLSGYTAPISGVAPHANLVIYYACAPAPVNCPDSATAGSVDQAIKDGIVDALNFSISGGTSPWSDTTSQAFLSAADSGIFVAAAGGNTSASVPNQVPGTVNHWEPWVTTVAAGTHTGGAIGFNLTVNASGAPGPVPLTPAASGTGLAAAINAAAIVVSPTFGTANDGCSAYAGGTFASSVALISYGGTCGTNTRAGNAKAAGATDVVIVANTDGAFLSGANQTIPVWTTGLTIGTSLKIFIAANPSSTVNVSYPASRLSAQADELANFSLLGPAGIDVIKPDVQAPGVNILAAVASDGTVNGPNLVALYDGTSMATPHTTGSGALLMGINPGWSPAEVKSALMMTGKEVGLTKADGVTPSDYFDRGSGRLQDYIANQAGLVLDESGLDYLSANPATGGDPKTLNIASMDSSACIAPGLQTCSFTRNFRSTQNHTVTWTVTKTGDAGLAITPSFASFAVVAHAKRPLTFSVDASGVTPDGAVHFAEIQLTPDDATLPTLHLPVAIAVPPPTITADPKPIAISIPNGSTTASTALNVNNIGGGTLNVTNTNANTGGAPYVVIDQPSQGNNGYYATFFTDYGSGSYTSDDFVVSASGTNLSKIVIPGFSTGTALSALTGHGVHFRIYANAAGLPDGGPEGLGNAPVYSYDTTIGATGLSVVGNTITLDLVAAGATATNLAASTYWLTVYVDMGYSADGGFAQFVTTAGQGSTGAKFGPVFGETNWSAIPDAPGFAMHIEEQAPCGAAWLSTNTASATIGTDSSVVVNVSADSTQFPGAASSATAFLCIDSDDANNPVIAIPVTAVQN